MTTSIAVDAGTSAIRLRSTHPDYPVTLTLPGVDPDRPLVPQWASAITSFLDAQPAPGASEVGVGASPVLGATAHELLALLPPTVRRVALTSDAVASYLGALSDADGAVIRAGTVGVCLACGPQGVALVDGWGPIFGEAGSAFWIGRTAVEAALRGHDGRRQMTALTEMVRSDFPDLDTAHVALQASPGLVARIAAYAPKVDALAASDRVAANILDKAAAHLSEAVHAAIRRAGLNRPDAPKIVAVGGVFDSARVRTRFCDYLTLHWPNFALTEPAGDELDGVERLFTLPTSHPLFGRVSFAER